jgi:hypothetical protein
MLLLSEQDIELSRKKIDDQNKLLFGFMLGYFKTHMNFPSSAEEFSEDLIIQICCELKIAPTQIGNFNGDSRVTKRFRKQIRDYLGYREPKSDDSNKFIRYLIENILPRCPSDGLLIEQALEYFKKYKIEAYRAKPLQRYINSAKYQFEQELFHSIYRALSFEDKYLIDQILTEVDKTSTAEIIPLSELKNDLPSVHLKHISYAIKKIELLGKVKIPRDILNNINRKIL